MIRNLVILTTAFFVFTSCASKQNLSSPPMFKPAQFKVSDVYVNMADGIENSSRVRIFMKNAGINTAAVYNETIESANEEFPLEIEVTKINYRNSNASAASGDRTYMRYTTTLREEASGEVYRMLPVTYYDVSSEPHISSEAKLNAEKNMIRTSIKDVFSKLYGMEYVPQNVQTYFDLNDIFADPNAAAVKRVSKPVKPVAVKPVTAAPVARVVIAPDEAIIESTTETEGGPTVLKCAVC